MNFNLELESYVASGYPYIGIITHEELRVQLAIKSVAEKLNKKLVLWTCTQGLIDVEVDQVHCRDAGKNPNTLFTELIEEISLLKDNDEKRIFVLSDFQPFFSSPQITRRFRDVVTTFKDKQCNVILVGAELQLPISLQKDITIIDFNLPTSKDLELILNSMATTNEIKIEDAEKEHVIRAATGLTSEEAENAFAKSVFTTGKFDPEMIIKEKANTLKKTGLLDYYEPNTTMQDVGGMNLLKQWLDIRSKAFTKEAKEFGLKAPKGIVLAGISGCGKSLVAKAIAKAWKLPLLMLDMGKIFGSLVGQSEQNIRSVINIAESMQPCVLMIDEVEKGLAGHQSSGKTDSGVSSRVFGTLLTWMQEKKSEVFLVATANNISVLPPEFLRKGRWDELFFVDLPNQEEKEEIFRIHIKKNGRDHTKFKISSLAQAAKEFTGSEIEACIETAMFYAFNEGSELKDKHITEAIKRTIPLSVTMLDELNAVRNWAKNRAINVTEDENNKGFSGFNPIRKISKN